MSLEPGDGLLRGGRDRGHREDPAEACPDQVRIVEVRKRVADDHGIGPGRVRAAEHGAQVPRLFHGFQHDDERMFRQFQVLEPTFLHFHLCDNSFRAFPVRDLPVQRLGNFDEERLCFWGQDVSLRVASRPNTGICSRKRPVPRNFRTHEYRPDGESRLEAMLQFAAAFHDKKALLPPRLGFLLQQEQVPDFRILCRCDLFGSQNFSGRMVGKNSTSWMASAPVMNMVRRSMPMPMPEVGGMPYSSARTKS